MGPINRFSLLAVSAAVIVGVVGKPPGLAIAAMALAVLAIHLFVWDPERNEMFADDWVEIAQAGAMLICALTSAVLFIAAAAVSAFS